MGWVGVAASSGTRIRYVDGLRAVAVLSVVAFHAGKYSRSDLSHLFPRIVMQGHHGVELFFVISGLCLSYPALAIAYERGMASFDVLTYGAKRLTRILPPFYAAIALFAVIGPQKVPAGDIIRQALFIDNGTHLLNSSFWSLPVEFRWYFLFPLLLLLWVRSPRAFLCLIGALFVLQQTRAESTDLVALPAFMLGIVAADYVVRPRSSAKFALPLCALVIVAAFVHSSPLDTGTETSVLWELAVFLLVIAAGAAPWPRGVLSNGALVFIGIASYSIYLCHELGVYYAERWGYTPWISGMASVALGIVFWYLIERPFTRAPLRDSLVSAFANILNRVFGLARLPAKMDLAFKASASLTAPAASAEQARLEASPAHAHSV
ncbi:MAG TPA: acyltransferase [Candidatus Baltobacteraceae bacterium]|nr:acyltransferase [Candidatus Baltobacteraceae bacterium]